MDIYERAGEIVHLYLKHKGSVKSLCLKEHIQKKKETMAIVCSTLQMISTIDVLLEDTKIVENASKFISKQNKRYFRSLIRVLVYECALGRGLRANDGISTFIGRQRKDLKKSLVKLNISHRTITKKEPASDVTYRLNYLKNDGEDIIDRIICTKDPLFLDLFTAPLTSLSPRHSLVKTGRLVVQSRPSCLPAHAICEATDNFSNVVDCCASPGNKTTHLCGLHKLQQEKKKERKNEIRTGETARKKLQVIAIEKDKGRFATLRKRIDILGASDTVTCLHGDFLEFQWDSAEVILCDPSCSANREIDSDRLINLARFQIRLLLHALRNFPSAKCVAYSTCSANPVENELVISMALAASSSHGWELHNALPCWKHRGKPMEQSHWHEYYEKCYPLDGIDQMPKVSFLSKASAMCCLRNPEPFPFFVAVFVRHQSA